MSNERPHMWSAVCALFAFAFFALLAPLAHGDEVTPSDRVVSRVIVRDRPDGDARRIGAMEPGTSLPLLGEVPRYYRVQLPNGDEGYVNKSWTVIVSDGGREHDDGDVADNGASFLVHVVDVGTGLAVIVEGPDFTLLYDGGSNDDRALGDNNRLIAYMRHVLPNLRVIDAVILSHPHRDHVELLEDVFVNYDVRSVWESGRFYDKCGYRRFLTAVRDEPQVAYHDAQATPGPHRVRFTSAACGQAAETVEISRSDPIDTTPQALGAFAHMTFLHADDTSYADPNKNSLVMRLDLGSERILFMGDADGGTRPNWDEPAPRPNTVENFLVENFHDDLTADVLIVGHHGSRTSSRHDFLDAVGATTFVISSGPARYGTVTLPDQIVVDELERRGALWRTDFDDDACRSNTSRIGRDDPGLIGGCDNIQIRVTGAGIDAGYYRDAD